MIFLIDDRCPSSKDARRFPSFAAAALACGDLPRGVMVDEDGVILADIVDGRIITEAGSPRHVLAGWASCRAVPSRPERRPGRNSVHPSG